MPHINRIRVNNVKYNFGTQAYDDFMLKPFGKNMLYDLANGGGKSVLMLLLLQTIIPNCTLDDKQPVEKLFRTADGSTTIHSLIEWELDDVFSVNGFRYMTTGFCARKATQTEGEGTKDTAAIEYFNYCIFYREYNENDIRNLPLTKDRERITYTGLKTYLKELEHDNSLMVRIFERKGEYQAFIENYGIYESEWEIIRGINKTEGHVRTYFESNYKTTRKVVEDLLIEEIIKTSFSRKSGGESSEDSMSKTLLDMKDKLVELAKKKDEIAGFDRQILILEEFCKRTGNLQKLYAGRNESFLEMNRIYNAAEHYMGAKQEEWARVQKELEQVKEEIRSLTEEQNVTELAADREHQRKQKEEIDRISDEYEILQQKHTQTQETISLRESMNEYLAYLEDKKRLEETKEALAGMKNGLHLTEEVKELVYSLKNRLEQRFTADETELQAAESKLNAIRIKEKTFDTRERALESEIAVSEDRIERMTEQINEIEERNRHLKEEVGLLLTEDSEQFLAKNRREQAELRNVLEERSRILKECEEEEKQLHISRSTAENELSALQWEIAEKEKKLSAAEQNAKRISDLSAAYKTEEAASLYEEIKRRRREASDKALHLKKELLRAEREKKRFEEGTVYADSEVLEELTAYIRTRHKSEAISGAKYLSALDMEEQKRLLMQYPFLPSALITKNYEDLLHDAALCEKLSEECIVPLVKAESLTSGKKLVAGEQMILLSRDYVPYFDEKVRTAHIHKLTADCADYRAAINDLAQMEETYEADALFVASYIKEDLGTQRTVREQLTTLADKRTEKENSITELLGGLLRLSQDIEQNELVRKDTQKRLEKLVEEEIVFGEIIKNRKQVLSLEQTIKEQKTKNERLREWRTEAQTNLSQYRVQIEENNERREFLKKQNKELRSIWEKQYEKYYEDGDFMVLSRSVEDLMTMINGKLQALGAGENAVADKQRLVDSYANSMNRLQRSMTKRGHLLAQMKELADANELYETSEEALSSLVNTLQAQEQRLTALETARAQKQKTYDRTEGMLAKQNELLIERYGRVLTVETLPPDMKQFRENNERMRRDKERQISELTKKSGVFPEEMQQLEDVMKEIRRVFAAAEIALSKECGRIENTVTLVQYFNTTEQKIQEMNKEIERRREEFIKDKQQTMETLNVLNAAPLAGEIGSSVSVPKNEAEALQLMKNIQGVNECLRLEKERTYAGIGDTLSIKDNFENQCLQRCLNIKADLERLTKLSKITLGEEQISFITLNIPYIKEEFYKERMTAYIDNVISEIDRMKEYSERMKYIRSALSFKRLFSVIVTDMNAIRLLLYKRERMKEQSRLLRYEEAVGSTGQSQGIYIQFLIAVINYIASINSPAGEGASQKKVIFIDNPFGAAKDVYIWEPIFELLHVNRVQLIVPARGTTPAITGRFDVNYLLGQKLIDGRQQTVVVDYYSQISAQATEFIPLEFEQTSLFEE